MTFHFDLIILQGGKSSNIFGSDAAASHTLEKSSITLDPKRNQTQNTIFGDDTSQDQKHINRRDPNKSSISQESNQPINQKAPTGKKMYSQNSSTENFQLEQKAAPLSGRRAAPVGSNNSFSLNHDDVTPQTQPSFTRRDPNARSEEHHQRPSSR